MRLWATRLSLGGARLSKAMVTAMSYFEWLTIVSLPPAEVITTVDLVGYFFRRSFDLVERRRITGSHRDKHHLSRRHAKDGAMTPDNQEWWGHSLCNPTLPLARTCSSHRQYRSCS